MFDIMPDPEPEPETEPAPVPGPHAPVPTPVDEPGVPATLPADIRNALSENAAPVTEGTPFLSPALSARGVGIIRLSGEYSELALSIDMPAVADVSDLRIAYQSSIYNLPGESQLTAILNGVEIATSAPTALDGFASVSLPREGLVDGRNNLVIRSELSHRIFCGPEASFGIWTEIDLAQSGIEIMLDTGMVDAAAFRRTMLAQLAAGNAVPDIAAQPVDPAQLTDLSLRLVALLPGATPVLEVQGPYAPESESAALARVSIVASMTPIAEIRNGADGALVLVTSLGSHAPDIDAILPRLAAIADLPAFAPGESATLADLGYAPISMLGRYGRRDLGFRLPADWLLISSQGAQLDLLYDCASGLPEGALMLV